MRQPNILKRRHFSLRGCYTIYRTSLQYVISYGCAITIRYIDVSISHFECTRAEHTIHRAHYTEHTTYRAHYTEHTTQSTLHTEHTTYRAHYTQYVPFVSLQINPLQAQLDMKGSSLAPKTLISVSADQALQLTLTRSSVGRILSLVDVSSSHAAHFCDWVDGTSNRCTNHPSCWYTDVAIRDSERNAN